jgi:hypothetical protein
MILYIAATSMVVSAAIVVERKEEWHVYKVQRPVYYVSEVLTDLKNMIFINTKTTLCPPDYFWQATTLLRRPQDYRDNKFPSWRHLAQ